MRYFLSDLSRNLLKQIQEQGCIVCTIFLLLLSLRGRNKSLEL